MQHRLQLGRAYFAGSGGVHVVRQDGTEYDRAEGERLIFDAWPRLIVGQVVTSRGRPVTVVVSDKMRRAAQDKARV